VSAYSSYSMRQKKRSKWPVVAVLVVGLVAGAAGGYWYGHRRAENDATAQRKADQCRTAQASASASASAAAATASTRPAPAAITANVYNATGKQGLASAAADGLRQRGFVVLVVGNVPGGATVSGTAEVRHGPAGAAAALVVEAQVTGSRDVVDARTDGTVDLVVGDAFAALASPQDAAATLAPPVIKTVAC
jgi:hypothetical protein